MARCIENRPPARALGQYTFAETKKAGKVRRKSMANLEYTIYNPITHHTIQDVDLLLSYKLIASYSLHPWFKTPKHGRAPWPFSPTVFFVPCHFHKSPGIQSQHLSGMETQLQLLRFWTECFWVQSLQAIHVYLLQPEGYREEFLLKEASPFTGQWYPTSDFSTFQQKRNSHMKRIHKVKCGIAHSTLTAL